MSAAPDLLEALEREAVRLGADEPLAAANGAGGAGETLRTYRGRSLEQLIPQIQQELGSDAVIVRRREGLAGGMFGFFQHAFVEVEATSGTPRLDLYDEAEAAAPPLPSVSAQLEPPLAEPTLPAPSGAPAWPELAAGVPEPQDATTPVPVAPWPEAARSAYAAAASGAVYPAIPRAQAAARDGAPVPSPAPVPAVVAPAQAPAPPPALRAEAPEFVARRGGEPAPALQRRAAVREPFGGAYVSAQLAALARNGAAAPGSALAVQAPGGHAVPAREPAPAPHLAPPPQVAPAAEEPARPAREAAVQSDEAIERALLRSGLSEELAWELLDGAEAHALALAPEAGLAAAVRATLAAQIPVAEPLPATGAVIVVVGGAGSGKTSACAALLAAYREQSTLRASCATLTPGPDGELQMVLSPDLRAPVAAGSGQALRVLDGARERGVVIVDTPSLSPGDGAGIRELARLLPQLDPDRVLVALPATLGAVSARQLLRALAPLGPDGLLVTHAQETDQLGVAVEAACINRLACEYTLARARRGFAVARVEPHELAGRLLP